MIMLICWSGTPSKRLTMRSLKSDETAVTHNYSWEWAQMQGDRRLDTSLNSPNPFLHLHAFGRCASCLDASPLRRPLEAHAWAL